ncbi:c6 transcription, partial [Moniliophthora roreri]
TFLHKSSPPTCDRGAGKPRKTSPSSLLKKTRCKQPAFYLHFFTVQIYHVTSWFSVFLHPPTVFFPLLPESIMKNYLGDWIASGSGPVAECHQMAVNGLAPLPRLESQPEVDLSSSKLSKFSSSTRAAQES